jgi:hypothetical protein
VPAAEGSELLLDDFAECVVALLTPSLSLQQISHTAEGMLLMAERPDRPPAARPIPVVDVQAVLERALNLLDWQELEERFASLTVTSHWCRDRIGHVLCLRPLSG